MNKLEIEQKAPANSLWGLNATNGSYVLTLEGVEFHESRILQVDKRKKGLPGPKKFWDQKFWEMLVIKADSFQNGKRISSTRLFTVDISPGSEMFERIISEEEVKEILGVPS